MTAFDFAPHLEDEKLLLRPLREDDWQALHAVAADPLIWELHPAQDRWREPVFRSLFDDSLASGGCLVIIDKQTNAIIGSSRFSTRYAEPGEIEIGWTFLARAYWGGATNRAIKRLMLDHAFRFAETAIFRVAADNWRSRRAMEKIGGTLTNRKQSVTINGIVVEHVIYSISRERHHQQSSMAGQ